MAGAPGQASNQAAGQAVSWADVLALVTQLDASGLVDAEVVTPGVSVRVSRHALTADPSWTSASPAVPAAAAPAPAAPALAVPAPAVPAPGAPDPGPATPATTGPQIVAPVLGVLYHRPGSDQPPFVQIGDTVTPDTTVAIIEVMKLMNPVTAGAHGVIAEICVPDAAMVEYGDVLFRLQG